MILPVSPVSPSSMHVVTIFVQMQFPLVLTGLRPLHNEPAGSAGPCWPRGPWCCSTCDQAAPRNLYHHLNSIPVLSLDILSPYGCSSGTLVTIQSKL